jgi:hypothetical protein
VTVATDLVLPTDNHDLVFQTGRRPAGAGAFVQHVYTLLADHPEGLARQEIDDALRDGWLATDVYRRYERHRTAKTPPYDSPQFKERARHAYATTRLHTMVKAGYAQLEADRYFVGPRVPRVATSCPARRRHLVPFDASMREMQRQQNESFVRRETVKSELLQGLNDHSIKGKPRRLLQLAFDYLSGR